MLRSSVDDNVEVLIRIIFGQLLLQLDMMLRSVSNMHLPAIWSNKLHKTMRVVMCMV